MKLADGGEAAGQPRLLAGGGVAVDDAFRDRFVERANRLGHGGARLGVGAGERRARGLHRGANLGADGAIAKTAAHVTMLQRSPTYIVSLPGEDVVANWFRRHLSARVAYGLYRLRGTGK